MRRQIAARDFVVPSACAKAGVLAMTTFLGRGMGKYHIRLNASRRDPFDGRAVVALDAVKAVRRTRQG